jgi:hypothetical protein
MGIEFIGSGVMSLIADITVLALAELEADDNRINVLEFLESVPRGYIAEHLALWQRGASGRQVILHFSDGSTKDIEGMTSTRIATLLKQAEQIEAITSPAASIHPSDAAVP